MAQETAACHSCANSEGASAHVAPSLCAQRVCVRACTHPGMPHASTHCTGGLGLAGQFNAPFTNSAPRKAVNGVAASLISDCKTATSPARRLNTAISKKKGFACFPRRHSFETTPTKERRLSISTPPQGPRTFQLARLTPTLPCRMRMQSLSRGHQQTQQLPKRRYFTVISATFRDCAVPPRMRMDREAAQRLRMAFPHTTYQEAHARNNPQMQPTA